MKLDAKRVQQVTLWAPLVLLAVIPLFSSSSYRISVWTFIVINLIVIVGLDLLLGFCGQLSLGHGVFVSLGAYASAFLTTKAGWSGWAAIPVGMVAAGVTAFLIGVTTMRLRGYYLAMATLGFPVVFDAIIRNWSDFTGGSSGVFSIPRLSLGGYAIKDQNPYYFFVLLVFCAVLLIVSQIANSRFGLSLRAIHRDEVAAEARGIDVYKTRIAVFVMSAVLAALSGSLYVHYVGFVSPQTFGINYSIMLVVMLVVGGAGRIWGGILGTVVIMWLPEVLRSTSTWEPIIFGAILAVIMLFFPAGIAGLWKRSPMIATSPDLPNAGAAPSSHDPTAAAGSLRNLSSAPVLLSIDDLGKNFGGVRAVDGLRYTLQQGQIKAIIGPNGAGKSTALALIAGAIFPDRGRIRFNGHSIEGLPAYARARLGIGKTFQHVRLIHDLTIRENVALGIYAFRGEKKQEGGADAAVWQLIDRFGLAQVADRYPSEVNPYHCRLTELCAVIAGNPHLLLLDEPAAGLSKAEVDQLAGFLRVEREIGRSIILVDHVMQLVLGLADEILVLDYGIPIAEGTPESILNDGRVKSAYLGTKPAVNA